MSDETLLRRWAKGDRSAGQAFVVRHEAAVRSFVARRTRPPVDVDDIVQQTFLDCMTCGEAFRGEGCARSFVMAIARNEIYVAWRKHQRLMRVGVRDGVDPDAFPASHTDGVSEAREAYVASAVASLPCHLREPLQLVYWDGLTRRRIGLRVNAPPGTVASRVRLAKSRLRKILKTRRDES